MHAALGNDFTGKVSQLFQVPDILQQHGAARPAVCVFWLSTTGAPAAVVNFVMGLFL